MLLYWYQALAALLDVDLPWELGFTQSCVPPPSVAISPVLVPWAQRSISCGHKLPSATELSKSNVMLVDISETTEKGDGTQLQTNYKHDYVLVQKKNLLLNGVM